MENSEIKWRVLAAFAMASLLLATGGVAGLDREPPTDRILGGDEASPGEFPFMAALDSPGGVCGCSIIDKRHVLTAAHCVTSNITNKPFDPRSLEVKVGCHLRTDCNATYKVNRVMVHHAWKSKLFWLGNDIAVLELEEGIEFKSLSGQGAVDSIDLAPSEDSCCDTNTETLTAIGWGRTEPLILYWGPLMKAKLDSLPLEECRAVPPFHINSNEFICTRTKGKNVCSGDSGGPLIMNPPYARPIQVGIASFVHDDYCDPAFGGVFTKVSAFRGWIEQCTNNGTCPTL